MSETSSGLRNAVAEAAGVSYALWLSYLFTLFYLTVATAGVTHLDLFLENGVKLPFLSVDLPLKGFFYLGPLILLIAHTYVLIHFYLLARKVRAFADSAAAGDHTATLTAEYNLLPTNIFVQFLAHPRATRLGVSAPFISAIIWISLFLAPVLTLVFFELQFLPYQSSWVTWWHRGALLIDLLLAACFWPAITAERPVMDGQANLRWIAFAFIGVVGALSLTVVGAASFPGEGLDDAASGWWLHRVLVAGAVDLDTLRPDSLWSNRLVLPSIDQVDHKIFDNEGKLAAAPALLSVRNRSLRGAVLSYANLPRTDFTAADLRGASLDSIHAQGSWFDYADLSDATLDGALLQGASFYAAILQGASLDSARLQGGKLAAAQMQGAWLSSADFEGATLASADLRRTVLDGADLRGSNLYNARLQGASLRRTKLAGTSFSKAFTWRSDFRDADQSAPPGPFASDMHNEPEPAPCADLPVQACSDKPDLLRTLVTQYSIEHAIQKGSINQAQKQHDLDMRMQQWQQQLAVNIGKDSPPPADPVASSLSTQSAAYQDKDLRELWRDLACAGDGAPFVLDTLVGSMGDPAFPTMPHSKPDRDGLVHDLLEKSCTAAPTFTDASRMQLGDLLRPATEP